MRPDEREDGADMADMMRRGEHIWLRQSATFAVDGQTRMVEIAIPLRPGASAEEIEALLRQADAGMERLGRHLDARVAAARGVPAAAPTVAAPPPAPPAPTRVEAPAPAALLPPTSPGPALSTTPRPAPTPAGGEEHSVAAPKPAAPAPARSGGAPVRETAPTPRASPPPPPPPSQPARTVPAPPPAPSAAPLMLPQFLAEAQAEFGFTPKQVMEHLNVRSLSGVNYREALETLRRQSLREGAATPAPPRIPAASASPAPSPPPAAPRYFEEELDEPEVVFGIQDQDLEGGALDGNPNPYAASDAEDDEEDDALLATLDLEEAEDDMPPPTPIRPSAGRPRAHGRAAPAPATAPTPAAPAGGEHDTDGAEAVRLITQLRDVQAGGVPSSYQRTAYRNLVVGQLGDEKAKAVVAALYRVSPERLGPEQLDALVSWGKRDGFADEVELVLAELRAERARAARQTSATSAAPAASAETAPRRAPRTEKKD